MTSSLFSPVSQVPGVGPRRAEVLERLGITSIWRLLFHLPTRYEDLGHPTPIAELRLGEPTTVRAKVVKTLERRPRGRSHVRSLLTVRVWDGTAELHLVFFNQKYLKEVFLPEREFYVYGRPELSGRVLQMASPDYEPVVAALEHSPVRAVYPLTEGISQRAMRAFIASGLDYFNRWGEETLPEAVLAQLKFPPLGKALAMVHTPYAFAKAQGRADDWRRYAELGRKRLAFEELLYLQLQVQRRRRRLTEVCIEPYGPEADAPMPWLPGAFIQGLPFALTKAQERAVVEIAADLRRPVPMHRLLVGDVGSGKTVVFLYALLYAIAHNDQAALLAPTEVLAEQHYQTITKLLSHLPVSVSLLTGSTGRLERQGTLWDVGAGQAQLTVGTHAVLEDDLEFRRLRMVVIDEQHKFGVRQRARLVEKGRHPHLLVTSATPIPRTLALTLYGDLDLTVLDEMPPGRTAVETHWVDESHLREVYADIRRRVAAGQRAFIVCPLIEASEALPDLSPLLSVYEDLSNRVLPTCRSPVCTEA
ncbi:DEAD/DEAH box helicase [bacterium]|nr:DEAD/DEAH box helicase [bacterium]